MYERVQRKIEERGTLDIVYVLAVVCVTVGALFPYTLHAQDAPLVGIPEIDNALNEAAQQPGSIDTTGPGASPNANAPAAQGALLRDGIFGCNASKYANIGTLSAVGGTYVPVNDAAVTINTGYLVYKECVLDGVIAKISEAARTDLAGSIIRQSSTARNGQALYAQRFWPELQAIDDKVVLVAANEENIGVMCPAFKNPVRTIEVRRYLAERNAPNQAFACSFPNSAGDHEAALRGDTEAENVLAALDAFTRPGNDPYTALIIYDEYVDSARAAARYAQEKQWDWGNGFYSVTNMSDNPFDEEILTPAYLVGQGINQAASSGFRCLEGADELSEVCAPLFSGLTTQLIADLRGLTGLSQGQNGLPSYITRMVGEAGAAVRQEAVNAALNVLVTARQIEALYKQAKEGIVNVLTNAINRLRNAEKTCWDLIIPKVKELAGTQQLAIATSTEFSQAVIDAQIAPVATIAAADFKKSEQALLRIDQIIASVTNTGSAAAQRQALEQLDTMVANGLLHTASQAQSANKQLEDVTASAETLVTDTLKAWGDSMDTNVGWCNINNPAVIQMWFDRWKK